MSDDTKKRGDREKEPKGRQTFNLNVDGDVKKFYDTYFDRLKSRLGNNMFRELMEQQREAPEIVNMVLQGEFRFAPKSKK